MKSSLPLILGGLSLGLGLASARTDGPTALLGPYAVTMVNYPLNSDIQNPEEDKVSVWFPSGLNDGANATFDGSESFKFISYAHGMFGGS
jgi:hypothetical protein